MYSNFGNESFICNFHKNNFIFLSFSSNLNCTTFHPFLVAVISVKWKQDVVTRICTSATRFAGLFHQFKKTYWVCSRKCKHVNITSASLFIKYHHRKWKTFRRIHFQKTSQNNVYVPTSIKVARSIGTKMKML